jgi:hypothetical protein
MHPDVLPLMGILAEKAVADSVMSPIPLQLNEQPEPAGPLELAETDVVDIVMLTVPSL